MRHKRRVALHENRAVKACTRAFHHRRDRGLHRGLAFAAASLITYWSGWPPVPNGVVLLAISAVAVTAIYRIPTGWTHALWYIVYILFLTLMTYNGDAGAQHLVNFDIGSLIVVIVSIVVFLPRGVAARLAEPVLTSQPGRIREATRALCWRGEAMLYG